MKVAEIVRAHPVWVEMDTPFAEVLDTMDIHQADSVPVVDSDRRLVGVIGISEITPHAFCRNSETAPMASALMRSNPPYVDEAADICDLVALLKREGCMRVPVVRGRVLSGSAGVLEVARAFRVVRAKAV